MKRLWRFLFPALLGLAVYYALFGGEYSVFEVRDARQATEVEAAELQRLQEEIDSLRAWVDSLEHDSATLERIARERFGMVRGEELLYRFVEPPDSLEEEGGEGEDGGW